MTTKKNHFRAAAALLLAAIILLPGLPARAAETTLTVTAPETLPAVGETFTVTVDLSGNPGLCAAQYTLAFDQSVLSCESAQVGDVLRGTFSATNPQGPEGAIVAAATTTPVTKDGTVGVFTFRVTKAGDAGFALQDLVFTDQEGNSITITLPGGTSSGGENGNTGEHGNSGSTGTGEGGNSGTILPAEPGETPVKPKQTFSDVPPTHWAYVSVEKAAAQGLVTGVGGGKFEPSRTLNRAEFTTMLWRMAGSPKAEKAAGFRDVEPGTWYSDAIDWAAEQGYVTGTGDSAFSPNASISRQEAVTILFRYSGGVSGAELMFSSMYDSQFTDSDSIAPWAESALDWAIYHGVITGTSQTTVSPTATATRAEAAALFVRYSEKIN